MNKIIRVPLETTKHNPLLFFHKASGLPANTEIILVQDSNDNFSS